MSDAEMNDSFESVVFNESAKQIGIIKTRLERFKHKLLAQLNRLDSTSDTEISAICGGIRASSDYKQKIKTNL